MTIREFIDDVILPLRPGDTVGHALDMFSDNQTSQLPVVDKDGALAGMIWDTQLHDAPTVDLPIDLYLGQHPISASADMHIFDATRLMVVNKLTTLAVTDQNNQFIGCLHRKDLFDKFASMLSTQEKGAILIVEVGELDYALSRLIHLIEQSDVKVLSVSSDLNDRIEQVSHITLKLNVSDTARIRHVLEYHGYRVVEAHNQDVDENELHFRAEEFMRYLEV